MDCEDDLDVLTALLAESEDVGRVRDDQEAADDLDGLFDEDGDEDEEYNEEEKEDVVSDLFGDVNDIEDEEGTSGGPEGGASEHLDRSKEDLQDELRRMQEQMQKLQQQLEASQVSSAAKVGTKPAPTRQPASKPPSASSSLSPPGRGGSLKLQESSEFSSQLSNADSFKHKPRMAHKPKASPPGGPQPFKDKKDEDRKPLVEVRIGSSFQPLDRPGEASDRRPSPSSSSPAAQPPLPKDVSVEKYSGLRLRKPLVSSCEMDRKMADRRLIRLSQVPERLTREKLEDSDWVTFAVLVNKVTPQSNTSGKTFSIWKLNDLHNLDVFVSLFLFGDVHKEHWKRDTGTVIGLLNPNPMKQRDGNDGVSLTVDHPQKVLVLGEARDFGTCKAAKKNGEPCSQIVNLHECQFCQYHVNAQYRKMSSRRAELQSTFSGKAPSRAKAGGLRERLCQGGFYYGGVSSASLTASKPKAPAQTTLSELFVRGSAQLVSQARRLAVRSGEVSGCSDEFKTLMSAPTPGALQLKKHLTQSSQSAPKDKAGAPLQSVSASDLLRQQKRKQRELLERRRQQNSSRTGPSSGPAGLRSPTAANEAAEASRGPAEPHAPALGRGFSKGDDILFFDGSPPQAPPPGAPSLSAAKMAALRKLRAKGAGLQKEDPNAVKRKRSNDGEISARVEKNRTSPHGEPSRSEEEPAQKKRRDQLQYVQSDEFQKILIAKSRHGVVLQAAEYQLQERYFDALVKKEQMEEKMKGIREMKCRAVTCKKCNYTYFKPADRCVSENHELRWHDAVKRFFRCPCGQRAIALDRLPHQHCSNCGEFKWERDGMLKEKTGPKVGRELLQPRGEEHAKFLK
ncbi:protein MCM10 homolog [Kryptolebias marmoratus]|uniref:Protein MCM10 homolog n=1 Tax=Kryptolebias marmoratus TaxID=37003 RepID=A0A3Q3A9P9_KRYMA|nr:protein MCM10 homolog [Kryptolebias marmoratus]XP_017294055.1 protein MCM10 homolog [Kryptolebias marmoratus]XP_037837233.1 protein MCM10 homolog [Kryptolebias marmoratus]XP_037837234.1 protein MCM10 homolog [Kryptolebias marmoratus]